MSRRTCIFFGRLYAREFSPCLLGAELLPIPLDFTNLGGFMFRYEMAEECADDDEAKASICELRDAVVEELKMHNSFAEVSASFRVV